MARGAGVHLHLRFDDLPLLSQAATLAQAGFATGASTRNWAAYGDEVTLPEGLPLWQRALLTDPQTSGGLLLAFFRANLPHRRTREGRDLVRRATLALRRRSNLGLADPLMPMALALIGASALGLEMQAFREAIAPMNRSDGSGSSGCGGSSDGGGDGGGGCGGCGGGD